VVFLLKHAVAFYIVVLTSSMFIQMTDGLQLMLTDNINTIHITIITLKPNYVDHSHTLLITKGNLCVWVVNHCYAIHD